jgi:hypothetical protein
MAALGSMSSNHGRFPADEQVAAFRALEGAGVVAVVAEEVVEVEVGHLVDFTDHLGAEVVAQQVVDEAAALLCFDPQRAEFVEVVASAITRWITSRRYSSTGIGVSRPRGG